jgi:hypothetical protein
MPRCRLYETYCCILSVVISVPGRWRGFCGFVPLHAFAAMIWQVVVAWSGTDAPGPIKSEGDRVVGVFSFPTKLNLKQLVVRRTTGGAWGRAHPAAAAQAGAGSNP